MHDTTINTHLENEERKEYIQQMKSAIIAMTLAQEGDGHFQGLDMPGMTKQAEYHGATIYLYLCDDGISGPTFVDAEGTELKVEDDPEELSVLQQILVNPYIPQPFAF
jgi:hypothetical protein